MQIERELPVLRDQAGDSIALISGLWEPFIIRKQGQDYKLIGPTYIYGIMEGQRWDDTRVEDVNLT